MRTTENSKSYLDNYYYKIGNQQKNFRVAIATYRDGVPIFSKWKPYLDAQTDNSFIERVNQREQLNNEINFELDSNTEKVEDRLAELSKLIDLLKKDGIKFIAYSTEDGRARRVETHWEGLGSFSKIDRENIRERLIRKYNCDPQLKSDSHMLSFGIHFKTNKLIKEVEKDLGKNILDYKIILSASEKQREGPIEIDIPRTGVLVSRFALEISEILKEANLYYRPRSRNIIQVEMLPIEKDKKNKVLGFLEMEPGAFVSFLEQYIIPGVSTDKGFRHKSLNSGTASLVLASNQLQSNLPVLDKLYTVPMPILRDNTLMFPNVGYDPNFWSYLPEDAPRINPNMSLIEAKNLINKVYEEFCFKNEQDKTNAIAALLTPFIRGLYSRPTCRTPIFFYQANRERAGKDCCAGITSVVYDGEVIEDTAICDGKETHDDEFRKKILSTFKMGRNRIHSSNNKGYLNSAQLEGLATSENFTDRELGKNTMLTFPNTLELSLSANQGITYTPDLANRCIFINLFLEVEDPNTRKFKNPDLHGWIRNNRGSILSALYALIHNWIKQGAPKGKTPFSSFPEWAAVCGGIMKAAELGDPCVPNNDAVTLGGDAETQDMKRLFELCFEQYPELFIPKKQIIEQIENNDDFKDLFSWLDYSTRGGQTKIGLIIEKFVGRYLSDIQLLTDGNQRSARRQYKFTKIGNLKPKNRQKELVIDESGNLGNLGNLLPMRRNIFENENNWGDRVNVTNVTKVTKKTEETTSERLPTLPKQPKTEETTSERLPTLPTLKLREIPKPEVNLLHSLIKIKDKGMGVSYEVIEKEMKISCSWTKEETETDFKKLLLEGYIYEFTPGFYKVI
jgi:hypothetical protein